MIPNRVSRPLFEFDLAAVEDIVPWGEPGAESLSWFALTDGHFRMRLGEQILFRYTDRMVEHWGLDHRDADYQIAAFVRDILGAVAAAIAPVPSPFQRLAANWQLLCRLHDETSVRAGDDDEWYEAWRWLGERSPWTSYLVATPRVSFVRVGQEVVIGWDNRSCVVEGIPVWTSDFGAASMCVEDFLAECHDLADRLLAQMDARITQIERGISRPQVEVDVQSLREQHQSWISEFKSYFQPREPDIPWDRAERAMRVIAQKAGVGIPVD